MSNNYSEKTEIEKKRKTVDTVVRTVPAGQYRIITVLLVLIRVVSMRRAIF